MIRFRSTGSFTNTNTFWTEVDYQGSVVSVFLTSSFSGQSNSAPIFSSIYSNKFNGYGSWVLIQTLGDLIPTASGQYTVNIFGATTGNQLTWGEAATKFSQETSTWGNVEGSTVTNQLLAQDRAYISGSDYDDFSIYNYRDNPVYAVYNG